MAKLEFKRVSEISRKEVAERIIALGHALASGSEVEMGSGGDSISIVVADRVRWELEIEVDGNETEIEIEISWRDAPSEVADITPIEKRDPPRRTRARKSTPK